MFGDSMFITLWLDEMINCYAKFACIGGFKLEVVNVIYHIILQVCLVSLHFYRTPYLTTTSPKASPLLNNRPKPAGPHYCSFRPRNLPGTQLSRNLDCDLGIDLAILLSHGMDPELIIQSGTPDVLLKHRQYYSYFALLGRSHLQTSYMECLVIGRRHVIADS